MVSCAAHKLSSLPWQSCQSSIRPRRACLQGKHWERSTCTGRQAARCRQGSSRLECMPGLQTGLDGQKRGSGLFSASRRAHCGLCMCSSRNANLPDGQAPAKPLQELQASCSVCRMMQPAAQRVHSELLSLRQLFAGHGAAGSRGQAAFGTVPGGWRPEHCSQLPRRQLLCGVPAIVCSFCQLGQSLAALLSSAASASWAGPLLM